MSVTRRELLAFGALTIVGGTFGVSDLAGNISRWVPARRERRPAFVPDVELRMSAVPGEVQLLPGAPTRVWRYVGEVLSGPKASLDAPAASYLGPTVRLRRGQKVRITFRNKLPEPSIIHWHGLDVPEAADGHPRLAIPSGAEYVYEFEVTNRAGMYWYHPHPHMRTGAQVYGGLSGVLIVTDDEEAALGLPSGAQELTCVLQDRRFDAGNQMVYSPTMMDRQRGFLGGHMLVNGTPAPTWQLDARPYRLRVLNGSNARIYKLAWSDGTPMTVLGTDGGLLERPLTQRFVTLAPAQRADLWLDLGGRAVGARLELRTASFIESDAGMMMGGMGMGMGMGRGGMGGTGVPLGAESSLLSIEVARAASVGMRLPAQLSTRAPAWDVVRDAPVRRVAIANAQMEWTLGGRTFSMTDAAADETVQAGSTHVWELVNAGGPMGMQMAHPIHLHGHQFRVLSRVGGASSNTLREGLVDGGWTDTVLVLPGETVRIQVTFSSHPGLYLYHCHILEHEDMGMMRNFRVVAG